MKGQDLYGEFLNGLPEALKSLDPCEDYDHWTKWILGYFSQLGTRRGMDVRVSQRKKNKHEFLLDLCWLSETDAEYRMVLALESEWQGRVKIIEDFKKLLYMKAEIKIVVCAVSELERNKLIQEVREHIKRGAFKNAEEGYLIINLPDSDDTCETRVLTVTGDELITTSERKALRQVEFKL